MKQMLDEGEDVLKGVLAKAKEGDSANAALVLNRMPIRRTAVRNRNPQPPW